MADITGVVLGAIPLVIYAIDNYRDPMRTFFKYNTVLETFKYDLLLQQEQLHATLSTIGVNIPLVQDELDEKLHHMSQSQRTLYIFVISEVDKIIKDLLKKLKVDARDRHNWTSDLPDRAKWEWARVKRTLRSKDRKEVIDSLQRWNTALKNCFERQELPFEETTTRRISAIQKRFSLEHCNTTRSRATAVHRVLEKNWNCSCRTSHRVTMDLLWHCDDDAIQPSQKFKITLSYPPEEDQATKSMCAERWHKTDTWVDEEKETLRPETGDASIPTPGGRVKFASSLQARPGPLQPALSSRQTLEPKDSSPKPTMPKPTTKKLIRSDLCSAFKKDGHTDPFEETVFDGDDVSKRKVRLSISRSALASSIQLTSMRSLLDSRQSPRKFELSLRQRLCMAAAITSGVLHLGESPWLDNAWQREGLQFFLENGSNSQVFPDATPCISTALSKGDATTSDHGSYALKSLLQYGNIRNKTLFILGVCLIELGLDRSFEELRKDYAGRSDGDPISAIDDYDLTIRLADKLFFNIGSDYGYATMRCLRCEFPGRDTTKNFDHGSFRRNFFNSVVAPVQATFSYFTNHKFG